jgi:hypothetical protein
MTIQNKSGDCLSPSNDSMGHSAVFKGLAENIILRYTNRIPAGHWATGKSAKPDIDGSSDGGTWSGSGSSITGHGSGSITYYRAAGDATISATSIGAGETVIVEVGGKATIAGNITYTSAELKSIYEIPQVLIFAGDIDIKYDVTQIDAWLLAGLKGGGGVINTCANGIAENTLIASNGGDAFVPAGQDGDSSSGGLSEQCRKRLKINGPTQAKQLRLLRSYGAGMGLSCVYPIQWPNGAGLGNCGSLPGFDSGSFPYDSATPAEVFNLRADAYLWAYRQAENYSQAFVTYSREVAPRY